jgi:hypothetical protein
MMCVDIEEDGYTGKVVNVVLATETDDISPARSFQGHLLVYDEHRNPIASNNDGSKTGTSAVTIADHRDEWPRRRLATRLRRAALPGLDDIDDENTDEDDDLEPLDEKQTATTPGRHDHRYGPGQIVAPHVRTGVRVTA